MTVSTGQRSHGRPASAFWPSAKDGTYGLSDHRLCSSRSGSGAPFWNHAGPREIDSNGNSR
jgi:hypothetical protein